MVGGADIVTADGLVVGAVTATGAADTCIDIATGVDPASGTAIGIAIVEVDTTNLGVRRVKVHS